MTRKELKIKISEVLQHTFPFQPRYCPVCGRKLQAPSEVVNINTEVDPAIETECPSGSCYAITCLHEDCLCQTVISRSGKVVQIRTPLLLPSKSPPKTTSKPIATSKGG